MTRPAARFGGDLRLVDEGRAADERGRFRAVGRDLSALRRLSEPTRVHVVARRSYLEGWGGSPGYRYLLESFVPRLRATGLDEEVVRRLLVDNP